MPKKIVVVITGVILLAMLAWFLPFPPRIDGQRHRTEYDIPRRVSLHYEIRNTGNRVKRGARFYVYAPLKQTGAQLVRNITSDLPHHIVSDALGHQLVVFDLPALPPYGRLTLSIDTQLGLNGDLSTRENDPLRSIYLQAQPFVDCNDPAIRRQAQYLRAETPLDTARNIYQWVAEHLDYTGPSGKDRGALHALKAGQGDCTDAAYLVAALCRASGIAARCVGGYVCPQDKNLRAREFHNWAEFWSDGRWRVADPVNRCFADRATTYIITRIWQVEKPGDAPDFFWRHRLEGENLAVRMIG